MTAENKHVQRRVSYYVAKATRPAGYVAWCSCGMGSPLKPTKAAARASLAIHTYDPREFPR